MPFTGSGSSMTWHDPSSPLFRVSGFPWYALEGKYRRLPLKPAGGLPQAVDKLANCTAGGQISFQSDSNQIAVQVELSGRAGMPHMPATGQCGFDLYIGPPFAQRFHSVAKYEHTKTSYEVLLFEHPERRIRNFALNFPLYQGVKRLRIGLGTEASIKPPIPWSAEGRIVFYGTSITQGGCASRPGMAYTNIISRALNMDVINLGFSGSGRGEPEVISAVADVTEPKLFVLDYEANAGGELAKTLPVAIRVLRSKHADVPVIVVSRIAYSKRITHECFLRWCESTRDMQAQLVEELRRAGDTNIHFVDGSLFLGSDFDECTVDGSHPNDLGFMRIAKAMEREIRDVLVIK